ELNTWEFLEFPQGGHYVASSFQSNFLLGSLNSLGLGNLYSCEPPFFLLADEENVTIYHNIELRIKLTLRYSCNISIYKRLEEAPTGNTSTCACMRACAHHRGIPREQTLSHLQPGITTAALVTASGLWHAS
uniref:Uncharacterized protein n=1 Tax=Spermophilus dauricus TaxID=99837 RepID=A0A8C9QNW3_SPEDA